MRPDYLNALAAIRYGYGRSPHLPTPPADDVLASLRADDRMQLLHPAPTNEVVRSEIAAFYALNRAAKRGESGAAEARDAQRKTLQDLSRDGYATIVSRALGSPTPLRERLIQFWADHFTAPGPGLTSAFIAPYFYDTIGPRLTGRFADLLSAVARHPLMLAFLDQNQSVGPGSPVGVKQGKGLNENYARELLELHTLGVDGAYDQGDVRQLALLLTGLRYSGREGFVYDLRRVEPGAETVMGRSYGGRDPDLGDIDAALADLARHPDTARHLSHRLAAHFVADAPPAGLVDHMAATWRRTDGDLMAVYGAMLSHDAAWAPDLAKAKMPFGYIVSALRALGVDGARLAAMGRKGLYQTVITPMRDMGQPFYRPPGPDGWSERAEAWITPQSLSRRILWAMSRPAKLVDPLPDPRLFVDTALGPLAGSRLHFAAGASESVPQGVGLVLASPEFNRR